MKLILLISLTLAPLKAFSHDSEQEFTVRASDISRFICEDTMHVYIVENCIKEVNRCIQGVMAQRILLPNGESQRFIAAIKECRESL